MYILSTKILTLQQCQRLRNSGFDLSQFDFIKIDYCQFPLERVGDLLLFTSQNAVKSVLQHPKIAHLQSIPAVCVGEKTSSLLTENGFQVLDFKHYASQLGEIITQKYRRHRITFFSGNLRRDTLPDLLNDEGIFFEEIQAYQTILTPHKMTFDVDALLFFSPSGVQSYAQLNAFSTQICFCIGLTTAYEAQKYTNRIVISEKPTIDSLISSVIHYDFSS